MACACGKNKLRTVQQAAVVDNSPPRPMRTQVRPAAPPTPVRTQAFAAELEESAARTRSQQSF